MRPLIGGDDHRRVRCVLQRVVFAISLPDTFLTGRNWLNITEQEMIRRAAGEGGLTDAVVVNSLLREYEFASDGKFKTELVDP